MFYAKFDLNDSRFSLCPFLTCVFKTFFELSQRGKKKSRNSNILISFHKFSGVETKGGKAVANGVAALGRALEKNKTVTTIDLRCNELGIIGAMAIRSALEFNKTLTTIYFSCNEIGDDGAAALARALETNKTLTTLDLSFNQISSDHLQKISNFLNQNVSLVEENLQE